VAELDNILGDVMGAEHEAPSGDLDSILGDVMQQTGGVSYGEGTATGADDQRPLSERIRELFRVSPKKFDRIVFKDYQQKLQKEYGTEPKFRMDPERPEQATGILGGRVDVPELGRGAIPRDIDPVKAHDKVAMFREDQARLLDEVRETGETVGFGPRFWAGIKATPQGRFSYLQEEFGKENVFPVYSADNKVDAIIINEPGKRPKVLDSLGLEVADLADISGDALEIGADVALTVGGGALLRRFGITDPRAYAALESGASLAAHGARRAASEVLPGDDEMTAGEQVGQAAVAALAPQAIRGITKVAKRLTPTGIMKAASRREVIPETVEQAYRGEGAATGKAARQGYVLEGTGEKTTTAGISKEMDVPLSFGQATGSPFVQMVEGTLARLPDTAQTIGGANVDRLRRLAKAADAQVKSIAGKRGASTYEAGKALAKTTGELLEGMAEKRTAGPGAMFREADNLVQGRPVIDMTSVIDDLDGFIKEAKGPAMAAEGPAIVKQVSRIRDRLEGLLKAQSVKVAQVRSGAADLELSTQAPEPLKMRILDLQAMLSDWTKFASGSKRIGEAEGKALPFDVSKRIGKQVKNTLLSALNNADPGSEAATQMLRDARKGWAIATKEMDDAKTAILDYALKMDTKGSPSKIVDAFKGRKFTPEQIETTMGYVDRADKATAQQVRGAYMADMLDKSVKGAEGAEEFSATTFSRLYKNDRKNIKALFKGDPKGMAQMQKIAIIAGTVGKSNPMAGSPTAPMLAMIWGLSAMTTPAKWVKVDLVRKLSKQMARTLMDPNARELVLTPAPRGLLRRGAGFAAAKMTELSEKLAAIEARSEFISPKKDAPDLTTDDLKRENERRKAQGLLPLKR